MSILLMVILWYLLGLLGSAIGLGAMDKSVGFREKSDRKVGYLMAIGGVINLGAASVFSLKDIRGFHPTFYWMK